MMDDRKHYVIERRDEEGRLDFKGPQPEGVFGMDAITGIDEDRIAQIVWRHFPEAVLEGAAILDWAAMIDPAFRTRAKYW